MVAAVPLNCTVFSLAVALNPWPEIVTTCPGIPRCGEKPRIASAPFAGTVLREIDNMLPTLS
jgi:hypothetical protein